MKISKILVVFFVVLTASTFAQTIVQTGTFKFDWHMKDYTLDKNDGERVFQQEVAFDKPFNVKPEVIVCVDLVDSEKTTNVRYEVRTLSVSRDGFLVQVRTWADTKLYGVGGQWMAVGVK
jgi:hypothetical protein